MTTRVTRNLLTPELRSGISLPTVTDFDAIKSDAAFSVGDCVTVAGRIMRKISAGWIDVTPPDVAAAFLPNTEGAVAFQNLPRLPGRSIMGNPKSHNDLPAFIGLQTLRTLLGERIGVATSSASGWVTIPFSTPYTETVPTGIGITPISNDVTKRYSFGIRNRTLTGFDIYIREDGDGLVALDFSYIAKSTGV